MSLQFIHVVYAIEAELKAEYLPGAIAWADKNHGNAWSRAIDEFDHVVTAAMSRYDYPAANAAAEKYKETVLDLIRKYKAHKQWDDATAFLASIRGEK